MENLSQVNIYRTRHYKKSGPLWLIALLILSFALVFVAGDWYVCAIYKECAKPKAVANNHFEEIYFKPNQTNVNLSTNLISAYPVLQGISENGLTKNQELIVEGRYYKNETEALGLKRASNIDALLKAQGINAATTLRATYIDADQGTFTKYDSFYKGAAFKVENKVVDTFKINNQTIYYALNSSASNESATVLNFLKEVSERYKSGAIKSVAVLGHTDNLGAEAGNYTLGLKRAKVIGNILASYGIPQELITVESKGENSPAATNSTFEGRALNRRVELITK